MHEQPGICTELSYYNMLKCDACYNYQYKSNRAVEQCPGKHIIFSRGQVIMVVGIELGDVGGHSHGGKSHHHSSEVNKNTCQAILFGSKRLFFGKEISIDKT